MDILLNEAVKPKFSDFWISSVGYNSSKTEILLQKGDYVLDNYGIAGIVTNVNNEFGNYIQFIDGYETYDNDITIKKINVRGKNLYDYQKTYFSLLVKAARILHQTISEFYPFTSIFNNGKYIWVRGSTLNGVVNSYTTKNLNPDAHSFISIKLEPKYFIIVEQVILKKSLRKSWFNRELIKSLFIDYDLNMSEDQRMKWTILDNNDYNKDHWKHYLKQYKKYNINYEGDLS